MSDDDVSLGELVRSMRRMEETLKGVVQRAVYEVQIAIMNAQIAEIKKAQSELAERADKRDDDDRRRNWLVAVALLGPVAGALFNFYLNRSGAK